MRQSGGVTLLREYHLAGQVRSEGVGLHSINRNLLPVQLFANSACESMNANSHAVPVLLTPAVGM